MAILTTTISFILFTVFAYWSARWWRQWSRTRRSPILGDVQPSAFRYVTSAWMLPEDWHPAGRRWPKPDETRTDEEAKAYARLAKSRSNGHLLSGEFLIALGGAMMGSVAMDVFSQGPNAEPEKEIGLVVAAVLVAIGLLLARMMSPSWGKVADRYEKFARPNRRRAPSRRRRAPSARRLPTTDAPTRRSKFSPFTTGTKRRGPADSSRARGRER